MQLSGKAETDAGEGACISKATLRCMAATESADTCAAAGGCRYNAQCVSAADAAADSSVCDTATGDMQIACLANGICGDLVAMMANKTASGGAYCAGKACTSASDTSDDCKQCKDGIDEVLKLMAGAPLNSSCSDTGCEAGQADVCLMQLADVLKANQDCDGIGDEFETLKADPEKFCSHIGMESDWCSEYLAPTMLGLMKSGFFPLSAAGLEAICQEAVTYDTPDAFVREFGKYYCDPEADLCCPEWGIVHRAEDCASQTSNVCRPAGECTVAVDSCLASAVMQATTSGQVTCPAGCSTFGLSEIIDHYGGGGGGSYDGSEGSSGGDAALQGMEDAGVICYNASVWNGCAAAKDGASCGAILAPGNEPACNFIPRCAVPPGADFGCDGDADACCVASSSPNLTPADAAKCAAGTSFGGLSCGVQSSCVQAIDPCSQLLTPWDCLRRPECAYTSTGRESNLFGASCISAQNPCRALSPEDCEASSPKAADPANGKLVPMCRRVDRCKTAFCSTKDDQCCALSDSFSDCFEAPGCTGSFRCLPQYDDCAGLTATKCEDAGHCLWNANQTTCALDVPSHPCSALADPYLCENSDLQCNPVPLCISGCTACEQCLADVYTNVVQPAILTNPADNGPDDAAVIFNDWCANGDPAFADACGRIVDLMYQFPLISTRAGVLCSLLNACDPDARCPALRSPAQNTTRSRLELCSQDGTNATAAKGPAAATLPAGKCAADADCPGEQVCDMEAAGAALTCTCEDGLDMCYTLGTCSGLCDTAAYQEVLGELQAQYATCTLGGGTGACPGGGTCQASADCVEFACTGSDLVPKPCGASKGLCVMTAHKMLGAQFSNSKTRITVLLDSFAAVASTTCDQIFDDATSAKLGQSALCVAGSKTLTIMLRGDATVAAGDILTLDGGQTRLVAAVGLAPFMGSLPSPGVSKCTACAKPVAVVAYAQVVAKPCDASDPAVVVLDGSWSRDLSGRQLAKVTWDLTAGTSAQLLAAFAAANNASKVSTALLITAPLTDLVENTPYAFALTITDFTGATAAYAGTFVAKPAGTTPMVRIAGGPTQTFSITRGIYLFADVDPGTVCPGQHVVPAWNCTATSAGACTLTPTPVPSLNLAIPIVTATAGQNFTFQLSAALAGKESQAATTTVVLTALASPLVAVIDGPTGDIPSDGPPAYFDSFLSSDPDDSKSAGTPIWDCYLTSNTLTKCPAAAVERLAGARQLAIKASALTPATRYTVALTMKKDTRNATTSVTITTRPPGTPTGRIRRECGWDRATDQPRICSGPHPSDDDLVLLLRLPPQFAAASILWSTDPTTTPGLTLNDSTCTGIATSALVVFSEALPTGTIDLVATITLNGASGTARLSVPIAEPPSCLDTTLCLVLSPNPASGTTLPFGTAVTATTAGWDGIYSFEFGVVDEEYDIYSPSTVTSPATSFTFTGLAPGTTTLYVCALDASESRTCVVQSLSVASPTVPTATLLANALADYTIANLTAPASPTFLMSSAADFAAAILTTDPTTLPAATQTALQTRIEAIAAAMLSRTWFPGPKDLAASTQLVSAVNDLLDAAPLPISSSLSTAIAAAVLDCIPPTKPIDAAQVDTIVTAVTATAGTTTTSTNSTATATTTTATAGRRLRRRLLATTNTTSAPASTTSTTATTQPKYKTITSAIAKVTAAYCANAVPGAGFLSATTESVSFTCAMDTPQNLNARALTLGGPPPRPPGPPGAHPPPGPPHRRRTLSLPATPTGTPHLATPRRRALLATTTTSNATTAINYTLPSNYASWCAANPATCGNTTAITLTYYAPPATWYLTAIKNSATLPAPDATATNVTLASGVLQVSVGTRLDICSTTTPCQLSATLPLPSYSKTLHYACLLLLPQASSMFLATAENVTGLTSAASPGSIVCTTPKTGGVIAVSYTLPSDGVMAGLFGDAGNVTVNLYTLNYTDSSANQTFAGPAVTLALRFNYDYSTIADAQAKAAFLRTVRVGIAYNLGHDRKVKEFLDAAGNPDISRVQIVGQPRKGSIIVDTRITLPASWSSAQVGTFVKEVEANPKTLFTGTVLENSVLSVQRQSDKGDSGVNKGAIAGGVIGGVAGIALVVGATVWIVRRRRVQVLQPDSHTVQPGV